MSEQTCCICGTPPEYPCLSLRDEVTCSACKPKAEARWKEQARPRPVVHVPGCPNANLLTAARGTRICRCSEKQS
jgi:hypothetical protein